MEQVIQFIKQFPTLPLHYCRKDSKLLYLEPGLSLSKMYTMYTEDTAINHKHVSKKIFDKIFHSLDLSFNNPRKDQCDTCRAYKQGSVDSVSFQEHIEMKDRARHFKALDKELAAENDTLKVVTMDMQQLLLCPKSFASAVYYKRKLSVHNLTLYDLKSKDVFCYLWHEGQGGLDSDEFASIIVDFLLSVPDNVESVIFWSDGCTYQNRNANLSSAMKYMFVNNLKPTLKEVHQKYLTRGHTQMEADSVHAAIETNSSKIEVYTPTEWETVIKTARRKNPYNVKTVDHQFWKKYSSLVTSIRPGKVVGDPTVTDICHLKYTKEGIFYTLSHGTPLRPVRQPSMALKAKYNHSLPLTAAKIADLKSLCETVIPACHRPFYNSLLW
ncbi:hypothetical protein Bpfe_029844 [Biomphalaria pfeifferi]|uniref:Uncharacterized protein n=1 Tax=Biomphalaria pfeifferi TaxID=112525 RepID=A0AAD8AQY2_BIOPF|nr:hypothetical protein Bpfe_029844 [Biomphalaria pfeifferi]